VSLRRSSRTSLIGRLFVDGPQSMTNSLSRSSMIMPTPNREATPTAEAGAEAVEDASQASTSYPSTPATSARDDDLISLQSTDDEGYDLVPPAPSPSTGQYTPDELEADEFDFVDESEDESQ
jgi:hypothetical protein